MTVGWQQQLWGSVIVRMKEPLDSFHKQLDSLHLDPHGTEEQQRDQYISTVKQWIRKNCPEANRDFKAQIQEQLVKEVTQRALDGIVQTAIRKELDEFKIYEFVKVFGDFRKEYLSTQESETEKKFRLQGELLHQWLKNPALFFENGKPKDQNLSTIEQDDFVIINN